MKNYVCLLLLITCFCMPVCSLAQSSNDLNAPEKILFNGKIFTANNQQEYAEAILIRGR
ncbi:MAG: hypothetical protein WDO19_18390 [Bacteroidota bacterium]